VLLIQQLQSEVPNTFQYNLKEKIWPIASFQVPKESHEVLKWVFNQTQIPTFIAAQENGQLLHVPDIGAFKVEWHIATDMKTIKCLYGLQHGSNSKHSCIYCLQEKSKSVITSATGLLAAGKNKLILGQEGYLPVVSMPSPLLELKV